MIQGRAHFGKVLTVLTVTYLLHVNAATDNQQVINEINRVENYMKTLQTSPEMIDALLKQVELHCQKNRSVEQKSLDTARQCVEQQMNVTQLADDMRAAIPEGKMETVFRDMCLKWPKVKKCMSEFFNIIEDCWEKGHKVSKFVDKAVGFYCGDDNSGERIAIFFAEGGVDCMQQQGDSLKKCVEEKSDVQINEDALMDLNEGVTRLPIPNKDQVCESVEHLRECTSIELRKCKDVTTENLMTSMLIDVGKALECKMPEPKKHQSNVSAGHRSSMTLYSVLILAAFRLFA